jgi:protein-histidine pros-kinase
VVVFVPVFGQQGRPDTVESRRSALRGFVLGVFRIGDMVTSALNAFDTDTIIYALHDLTAQAGEQLLWEHDPGSRSNTGALTRVRPDTKSAGLKFRSSLDMGGRNWTISFAPTFSYLASHRSWDVGVVLACGLLFSSLVGTLLLANTGRSVELSAANTNLHNEIIERTQAEAQLYESREKFRGLVESAPDAILIVDHQGLITFANRQVETVFGYQISEILDQPHDILLAEKLRDVHAGHRAAYRDNPYTRQMGKGLELFGRRKNGSEFPVEIGLSALQTDNESEVICIIRDVSERKHSEEALKKSQAELETKVEERTRELKLALQKAQEADHLKSAFLASMSHELRTPLNSIIGFSGILLQGIVGPLNDEQQKQLGMVQDSARHLLSLINEVLDLSKIEAGQLEITRQAFHAQKAIEKVIQTVDPLADKKGLALKAEVAPEVGEITSDRKRVEQILINLVNNAVKFTEKGEVRVDCRIKENRLVIQVTDTGIGIKPEDMGKVFQAFHQLDSGLTRRYAGTGLGLSICRKLTQLLNGDIRAESAGAGKGSTFTLSLPL